MDQFTEVTTKGFGSRIIESIKGVLVGLVLFVVAFPLLWWNEGNAVKTLRSLQAGAKAVIAVPTERVEAANQGKLVYVTGEATTADTVTDPVFGVSAQAIKLSRKVEMYQWQEKTSSRTKKNLGGSETTTKTYDYRQEWSEKAINSGEFKHPEGHQNPAMPFSSEQFAAGNVELGAFRLNSNQVSRMTGDAPADTSNAKLPESISDRAQAIPNGFHVGDTASPKVGDLRITFTQVPPQAVSIIARQVQHTFEPYPTKQDRPIDLLEMGTVSADSMFAAAKTQLSILTWILRAVGFFLMFVGLALIFRPVATLGDVVPFFGSMLRFGAGLFAGVIALFFSLITIAMAWIAYRPLFAIGLIVLGCLAGYGLLRLGRSKKPKAMAAGAQ